MHLKTGDLVTIISGRDKKLGPAKVARVYPTEEKVLIEGRNLRKRHMRGNESLGTQSRSVEIERPIYACSPLRPRPRRASGLRLPLVSRRSGS